MSVLRSALQQEAEHRSSNKEEHHRKQKAHGRLDSREKTQKKGEKACTQCISSQRCKRPHTPEVFVLFSAHPDVQRSTLPASGPSTVVFWCGVMSYMILAQALLPMNG